MLKVNSKVNGVVAGAASLRTSKDGKSYVSFNLRVNVPGSRNNMPGQEILVSVSKEGTQNDTQSFSAGKRIEVEGILTFRKNGDNLYFNVRAINIDFNPEETKDMIEGTLEFKGTLGNKVEEKTDKKGNQFIIFSAFSTDKVGEEFQFTWVRFIRFNAQREVFMLPKSKIQATGQFEVSSYNGRISLDCRCDSVGLWEKKLPFVPADGEEAPY
ncbi:MAG: hypothetical protein J1F38_04615 [Muribaculaceae bacterium]|nr:hypothetical protein [Muribaculaceae bacterium]